MKPTTTLALLLAAVIPAAAQQATLTLVGPAQLKINRTAQFKLYLQSSQDPGISGIYFQIPLPAGVTEQGHSSDLNGVKDIYCGGPTSLTCLMIGLNWATMPFNPPGTTTTPVATLQFRPTVRGQASFAITNPDAVSGLGVRVALAAAPTLTVPVVAVADLNGDGKTDGVDLLIMANQIVGITPCTNGDVNEDHACTLQDASELVQEAVPLPVQ